MADWWNANQTLLWWVLSTSAVMFVGGLILMPILLVRMGSDHFLRRRPPGESWRGRHPVFRLLFLGAKNTVGLILLLAGLAMLVLPGEGLSTILVDISLLNLPGKRRRELRIVRQPAVRHVINWIRSKAGRPALELPVSTRSGG